MELGVTKAKVPTTVDGGCFMANPYSIKFFAFSQKKGGLNSDTKIRESGVKKYRYKVLK
jgi:hypothetical protein